MTEISRGKRSSNTLGANCFLSTYRLVQALEDLLTCQSKAGTSTLTFLVSCILGCCSVVWILSEGLAMQLRIAYSAYSLPASTSKALGLQSQVCATTPGQPTVIAIPQKASSLLLCSAAGWGLSS